MSRGDLNWFDVGVWKGKEHFDAKVLWSVIAYNIRVMTNIMLVTSNLTIEADTAASIKAASETGKNGI